MLTISVSSEFSERVPQFRGAFLEVTVQNSATSPKLWAEIEASCEKLQPISPPKQSNHVRA